MAVFLDGDRVAGVQGVPRGSLLGSIAYLMVQGCGPGRSRSSLLGPMACLRFVARAEGVPHGSGLGPAMPS